VTTTAVPAWAGRRVHAARAALAFRTTWPTPCGQCDELVTVGDRWVVGHIVPRWQRPDLTWAPNNHRVEHGTCSDKSGPVELAAKRAADALAAGTDVFPGGDGSGKPSPLPVSLSRGAEDLWELDERLTWAHHVETAPEWLAPYLDLPEDASPPLAMTAVHPDAVGSYGPGAIEWIRQRRKITLRWWQQLAMVRQLEHDADGRLCWRNVVESAPRRAGKSERLRSLALWRLEFGVDLFEPGQVVMHFGRDLGVVREVQERAWPWCENQGWTVTRGNGKEVVAHPNGARWLAKTAAYTFDVALGLADECWDVEPGRISEDLEPATMERVSPQVVLTSTSHRRATSLMKRRIAAAMAADDGRTLLLLWGVPPGADMFAEETWRAASPHWTEDRREMIAAKLLEAREATPELDDPDPVGSWAHQYLNRWDLVVRRQEKGEPVVTAEAWAALTADVSGETPAAAAIESWFDKGVSLVLAWRTSDGVIVSASDHPDVHAAAAALRASGFRGKTTVGASLVEHPALRRRSMRSGEGQVLAAAQDLSRLLAEGVVRHDGGQHLTGQVTALRTLPGVNGPRMTSTGRADAAKAAVWALQAARAPRSQIQGIVLPNSGNRVTQNRQHPQS